MNKLLLGLALFFFLNLVFRSIRGIANLADMYGFWILPTGMFAIGVTLIVLFESR